MKTIIVQGSSRSKGNTSKVVEILRQQWNCGYIDLNLYKVNPYDYEHKNQNDDFLKLMGQITEYDLIIFATPVYWYSMSGIMKTFFDRITDCLKVEKETGRKLRGKFMAAVSCGSDDIETEGFFVPFQKSANYLGMKYVGSCHAWMGGESKFPAKRVLNLISEFAMKLERGVSSGLKQEITQAVTE